MTSMPSPSAWRRSGRLLIFSFPRSFPSRSGKQDPNSIPSSVPSPRIPHRRPLASSFLFVDDHGCRLSHSPSFFLLSDLAADLFSHRRYRPSLFLPYSLPTELSHQLSWPDLFCLCLPGVHAASLSSTVRRPFPPLRRSSPSSFPNPAPPFPPPLENLRTSLCFFPTSAVTHVFLLSFSAAVADAVHYFFLLLLPPLPTSPPSFPSPPRPTAAAAVASAPPPPCPRPPPLPPLPSLFLHLRGRHHSRR